MYGQLGWHSPAVPTKKQPRKRFSLPSIQHFEPVLSSSSSTSQNPLNATSVDNDTDAIHALPISTPSPHKVRNQAPVPTPTSSRVDHDLFRYNQSVKQRMTIRPLFEKRREENAQVARIVLSSPTNTVCPDDTRPNSSKDTDAGSIKGGSDERIPEPVSTVQLQKSSLSSSNISTCSTPNSRENALETQQTSRSVSVERGGPQTPETASYRNPTPPSSSSRRSSHGRNAPLSSQSSRSAHMKKTTGDSHSVNGSDIPPRNFHNATPPTVTNDTTTEIDLISPLRVLHTNDEVANEVVVAVQPVETITPSTDKVESDTPSILRSRFTAATFHTPFLEQEGSKLTWIRNTIAIASNPTQPPIDKPATLVPVETLPILYKLLWKDQRRISSDGINVKLTVLLSSVGQVHIKVESATTDDQIQMIDVTDSEVLQTTKARPDLTVMTPKWGEWLLTCVRRDTMGAWFLQIESLFSSNVACCFSEIIQLPYSQSQHPGEGLMSISTSCPISVTMYILGNSEKLLIHAREQDKTDSALTELVLHGKELSNLARCFGYEEPIEIRDLLKNHSYLHKVATESKMVCLALKSQLHLIDRNDALHRYKSASGTARCMSPPINSDIGQHFTLNRDALEAQGLLSVYPTADQEIRNILRSNDDLACSAFLAQSYTEDAMMSPIRWFERPFAVNAYVESLLLEPDSNEKTPNPCVLARIEIAKQSKLNEIAILSIIEDLVTDFIVIECRNELDDAKLSGGYDDYFASKIQSTYRMSTQRREYLNQKHVRMRAARLIQALQRGLIARRRYCEMRVEREKYLFYGIRSSLDDATASLKDPRQRAQELTKETERRRQNFLMQVLHGYAIEQGLMPSASETIHVSVDIIRQLFNEYGVVVGCTQTLGDDVVDVLLDGERRYRKQYSTFGVAASDSIIPSKEPQMFRAPQINAALLGALRGQYDDTFGLSSSVRTFLEQPSVSPLKRKSTIKIPPSATYNGVNVDENIPPRWLLKVSPPFQRANRNRIASLRLKQKEAGRQAAHLVAVDYRNLLLNSFSRFEQCRVAWNESIVTRREEMTRFDRYTLESLIQHALDKVTRAVKDWGLDPEPLFEALNLCLLHRLGKTVIVEVEKRFNTYADSVNRLHGGKRNIYPLRDEIDQELEDFERLLALRCLNISQHSVLTVPPSEILHVLLKGKIDDEYLRYALPAVLPIATIREKYELARKMIHAYANTRYADAFNSICWSCLDTAEHVTVEAAQFLDRITRMDEFLPIVPVGEQSGTVSVTTRALYLLTGPHALQFLQFLAKVAHFNKSVQRRVVEHLQPYSEKYQLYRIASVVCSLPVQSEIGNSSTSTFNMTSGFELVTQLFDQSFSDTITYGAVRFWEQYEVLFGREQAIQSWSEDRNYGMYPVVERSLSKCPSHSQQLVIEQTTAEVIVP